MSTGNPGDTEKIIPPRISFRHLKGKTVRIGWRAALQVGLYYYFFPLSSSPNSDQDLRFCALRITASFGANGFRITDGALDVIFPVSGTDELPVVYDQFPEDHEEVRQSSLEIGIQGDLTWVARLAAGAIYRTSFRKVKSLLDSGGGGTKNGWWKLERRQGEPALRGHTDFFLTVMYREGQTIQGRLTLEASLGFPRRRKRLTIPFKLPLTQTKRSP